MNKSKKRNSAFTSESNLSDEENIHDDSQKIEDIIARAKELQQRAPKPQLHEVLSSFIEKEIKANYRRSVVHRAVHPNVITSTPFATKPFGPRPSLTLSAITVESHSENEEARQKIGSPTSPIPITSPPKKLKEENSIPKIITEAENEIIEVSGVDLIEEDDVDHRRSGFSNVQKQCTSVKEPQDAKTSFKKHSRSIKNEIENQQCDIEKNPNSLKEQSIQSTSRQFENADMQAAPVPKEKSIESSRRYFENANVQSALIPKEKSVESSRRYFENANLQSAPVAKEHNHQKREDLVSNESDITIGTVCSVNRKKENKHNMQNYEKGRKSRYKRYISASSTDDSEDERKYASERKRYELKKYIYKSDICSTDDENKYINRIANHHRRKEKQKIVKVRLDTPVKKYSKKNGSKKTKLDKERFVRLVDNRKSRKRYYSRRSSRSTDSSSSDSDDDRSENSRASKYRVIKSGGYRHRRKYRYSEVDEDDSISRTELDREGTKGKKSFVPKKSIQPEFSKKKEKGGKYYRLSELEDFQQPVMKNDGVIVSKPVITKYSCNNARQSNSFSFSIDETTPNGNSKKPPSSTGTDIAPLFATPPDFQSIIRMFNTPLGENLIALDFKWFKMKIRQIARCPFGDVDDDTREVLREYDGKKITKVRKSKTFPGAHLSRIIDKLINRKLVREQVKVSQRKKNELKNKDSTDANLKEYKKTLLDNYLMNVPNVRDKEGNQNIMNKVIIRLKNTSTQVSLRQSTEKNNSGRNENVSTSNKQREPSSIGIESSNNGVNHDVGTQSSPFKNPISTPENPSTLTKNELPLLESSRGKQIINENSKPEVENVKTVHRDVETQSSPHYLRDRASKTGSDYVKDSSRILRTRDNKINQSLSKPVQNKTLTPNQLKCVRVSLINILKKVKTDENDQKLTLNVDDCHLNLKHSATSMKMTQKESGVDDPHPKQNNENIQHSPSCIEVSSDDSVENNGKLVCLKGKDKNPDLLNLNEEKKKEIKSTPPISKVDLSIRRCLRSNHSKQNMHNSDKENAIENELNKTRQKRSKQEKTQFNSKTDVGKKSGILTSQENEIQQENVDEIRETIVSQNELCENLTVTPLTCSDVQNKSSRNLRSKSIFNRTKLDLNEEKGNDGMNEVTSCNLESNTMKGSGKKRPATESQEENMMIDGVGFANGIENNVTHPTGQMNTQRTGKNIVILHNITVKEKDTDSSVGLPEKKILSNEEEKNGQASPPKEKMEEKKKKVNEKKKTTVGMRAKREMGNSTNSECVDISGVRRSARERKPPQTIWWKTTMTDQEKEKFERVLKYTSVRQEKRKGNKSKDLSKNKSVKDSTKLNSERTAECSENTVCPTIPEDFQGPSTSKAVADSSIMTRMNKTDDVKKSKTSSRTKGKSTKPKKGENAESNRKILDEAEDNNDAGYLTGSTNCYENDIVKIDNVITQIKKAYQDFDQVTNSVSCMSFSNPPVQSLDISQMLNIGGKYHIFYLNAFQKKECSINHQYNELIYVLQGVCEFKMGGLCLNNRNIFFIQRGIPYELQNTGEETAVLLFCFHSYNCLE